MPEFDAVKIATIVPVSMVEDARAIDNYLASVMAESAKDMFRPRYGPHRRMTRDYDPGYLDGLEPDELLAEAKELFELIASSEDGEYLDRGVIEGWEWVPTPRGFGFTFDPPASTEENPQ
jgi:hypothetical protein